MIRSSAPWPALKACLSDWPECFESGRGIHPEKLRAALEEIDQLLAQQLLSQPIAEAFKAVCEQIQCVLTGVEEGVEWPVPPPMWWLLFQLREHRAAAEQSDLTQTEASVLMDRTAQHLMSVLTSGRVLTENAGLQAELAHLILQLAAC